MLGGRFSIKWYNFPRKSPLAGLMVLAGFNVQSVASEFESFDGEATETSETAGLAKLGES